jgi:hypothetical protein
MKPRDVIAARVRAVNQAPTQALSQFEILALLTSLSRRSPAFYILGEN